MAISYSLDESVRFGCIRISMSNDDLFYNIELERKSPTNLLDTAESNGGSLQSLSSSYIMQSGLLSVSYSPSRTNCLKQKS